MVIGLRVGTRVGPRVGIAAGLSGDEIGDPLAGVTRDASSGILTPSTAVEWAAVLAVAGITSGGPSATYGFQEGSGNVADLIGSFTLTQAGTVPTYGVSVAGWSRKAIEIADSATTSFSNTSASLPDISTTSMSVLLYSKIANAAAVRSRGAMGTGFIGDAVAASGAASVRITGDGTLDGAVDSTGQVRPTWLTINRTASSETLVNNLEKLSIAFSGLPTGKQIRFGSSTNVPGLCDYLYAAVFFGAAAELTDAQRKSVLQTLNWSIPWS